MCSEDGGLGQGWGGGEVGRRMNDKSATGRTHRSWALRGLSHPATEFSLFLESNGKPLSGFKAEKEHNDI